MQKLKFLLKPKILRLLALGFILLASLFLLIQDNYGSNYMVALGPISRDKAESRADVDVLVANSGAPSLSRLEVTGPWLLLRQLEQFSVDTEFLAVIHQRGQKLVFERIYVLSSPQSQELQGPTLSGELNLDLDLAVGVKPQLVEMVGLNRFGYQLTQPVWAKQNLPGADMVYYQQGNEAVKQILDGENMSFVPEIFILDDQGRVLGLRHISGRLLTVPEFLRLGAGWLYGLGLALGLASFLIYKSPLFISAGKRIWDQVSMRWRRDVS